MPIVKSTYKPSFLFKLGQFSTIYSALFRKVKGVIQERERIILPDGDFLDLHWSDTSQKTKQLIIVLHGLEGNAQRQYMLGTAKIFNTNGFDVLCVNFRGCSGFDNLKYKSYHSGETEDLKTVLNHVLATKKYDKLFLKGFSLGANVILKYLGEGNKIPNEIKAAVAVSVPCYLKGCMLQLHKLKNKHYHYHFLKRLKDKLRFKQNRFSTVISKQQIKNINTLKDFDDIYTAIANDFDDAYDYYEKSSSLQYLKHIKTPTLILNAKNDSFLSPKCFPIADAKVNPNLYLEIPEYGGHVGFYQKKEYYYNEMRALEFLNSIN